MYVPMPLTLLMLRHFKYCLIIIIIMNMYVFSRADNDDTDVAHISYTVGSWGLPKFVQTEFICVQCWAIAWLGWG